MLGLYAVRQKILDIVYGPRKQFGYFSLERAAYSYARYREMALADVQDMRRSYARLGRTHKRIGFELGYPAKLTRLEEATHRNALVAQAVADLAQHQFPSLDAQSADGGDLARVRETLKHFVRDWSVEGAAERTAILQPILDALRTTPGDRRVDLRVLVPGAGLGRLAYEISELGYQTTANELSWFMSLGLRFLLSPSTTQTAHQHRVYPYAYWFSHQRTNDALFRAVSFPDVVPRLRDTLRLAEGDFLALKPPRGTTGYDYVVTLFFIDTSANAISTLEQIYTLLRPGGVWINLGPLLWPGGAQARVELSLEEVLRLAKLIGFKIEGQDTPASCEQYRRKTVHCEYTSDNQAMMKYSYLAEFWVARKPS
ncbi:hypothetical protein PHLGIDRAFT_75016 [Phlebiopsis gigantea 11061_1 CR5-6]|uniref:Uncharacterized protein n=1 Tax=Phlebiopsis gigantea (strain 11061_1 CR5-6) TaxID=745531 RepID=A0A0C3S7Z5_PHLG1|nr:hypothetical protein PHLGIDRAFT_75016 [Phlebiopsis gigantea 11061_1 CR5-6]